MKAEVPQQRSLLEVAELDAELSRAAHRVTHLAEHQHHEQVQADHLAAADRLAALAIAIEDLDAQVSRFESEIDGVRQREDRDRQLLDSGSVNPKQLEELQHELGTLERRQSGLEDSLLEVMERREQLTAEQAEESAKVDALQQDLDNAAHARNEAIAEIDRLRAECGARRGEVVAGLDPDLVKLYERQRAASGVGAARLLGRRCGACRIEIDQGEMARISAAADDEVLRCPECGAILLRVGGVER
ncbi:zinc ribbon domain-containing protein [Candidatus Mycolicibacterium alkanivorans]|uniref:C4-type zinc ribbon domain-containing protein n=1 Tax=Candidatus Mycolicibacterium alkanivorans TaxID=2954114 RepID=A0ABS9YVT2_9MYCO|nr:C4-type zinc ribbon domain-containing protein [Candidatus Mycolicibacterium alkanivorans]MCI4675357.1 C4-type zinc ribbon domain-containing protein [Candidatus Mycolicibacterium alkanivorans]